MTEAMKKHVGWFLIGAFIALCLISYTNVRKIDTLTNEKNAATQRADSLEWEVLRRDLIIAALDTAEAHRERERDSAQVSWKPVEQEQDAFVHHFDTAGIGAAIDSLNARPIGY